MNYPLQLSFKLMAIARQLSLREATGNLIFGRVSNMMLSKI